MLLALLIGDPSGRVSPDNAVRASEFGVVCLNARDFAFHAFNLNTLRASGNNSRSDFSRLTASL